MVVMYAQEEGVWTAADNLRARKVGSSLCIGVPDGGAGTCMSDKLEPDFLEDGKINQFRAFFDRVCQ